MLSYWDERFFPKFLPYSCTIIGGFMLWICIGIVIANLFGVILYPCETADELTSGEVKKATCSGPGMIPLMIYLFLSLIIVVDYKDWKDKQNREKK